jgi:uncharacterized protein YndB with AHSA1/START domain
MARLTHSIQVYAAFATEKGMRGWWTRDTRMDARVGGKVDFGFERRAVVFHMKIRAMQPGKSVRMRCTGGQAQWKGTTLEWRVAKQGKGSALSFVHAGWRRLSPYAVGCNSMWGHLMFGLKRYVESGRPGPQWKR